MLTKKVNGAEVQCTDEEETAILSEWAENNRPRTAQEIDNAKSLEADINAKFNPTLKAFALVVLDEINLLRIAAGLPERTINQLKNAVKAKL